MVSLPLFSFYFLPLLFFIFFVFKFFPITTTRKNFPPSPPKVPNFGNLHQLGQFPHRSFHSLAKKYGQLVLLHFGNMPVLLVSSASAAREIMKTHDLVFSSRPHSSNGNRLFYGSKDVAFSPYGEYWRQVRSICVLHLLSNKMVQSFRRVREEETDLMIDKIIGSSPSSDSSVNLTNMFVSLTNHIVCRVALGRKYNGEEGGGRRFKELLGAILELIGIFNAGDYVPWLSWINGVNGLDAKVQRVSQEMDEFLEGVVEEHIDRSKGE